MNSLDFAINMETDGEKYYKEQAQKNKGNMLEMIFNELAKDEKKHADILKNWGQKVKYDLKDSEITEKYKNVFAKASDFKSQIKSLPTQIDGYELALKKEKESIDLYTKMLSEVIDNEDKKLFEFLVKEEKKHYEIFDEIINHLRKAEEWVESPEFGLRKEEY
ncbi:MAG: ferritin-like domain-containing protein [Thermoanaerobacteraceae bacterium]